MENFSNKESVSDGMTMGEITRIFPDARRALFARYHIGGCNACAYQDTETLAEVCQRNEIIPAELIEHIANSHVENMKMMITPLAAKEMLDRGLEVRFVDTRTREEHEAVAIPDSYFMNQALQQEIFSTWDKSNHCTIILYDHTGKNVMDTCAWFIGHEMKNTLALVGGIDAWSQEIDPSIARYRIEI